MGYILSTKANTATWIRYQYEDSADYQLFLKGMRLGSLPRPIIYQVRNAKAEARIEASHLLAEQGPELVSSALREVLEAVAPNDIEFFPVELRTGKSVISGFHALNVIHRQTCFALEQCEYTQTNFDPLNPTYMFSFYRVADDSPSGCALTRVDEFPRRLAADERLKDACVQAKLKGLAFCRAVDLTGQGRGEAKYT